MMQEEPQARPAQQPSTGDGAATDAPAAASSPGGSEARALFPQQARDLPVPGDDGDTGLDPARVVAPPSYVFALGRIEARFPSLAVEKELAQSTGRAETAGLTDRQALQRVLSERRNRYLARQLCWLLTIEGLETYILVPRDPADLDLLIEALRSTPHPGDIDLVIGV